MAQEVVLQELKKWFLEHSGVLTKVDVKHISDLEGYGLVTQDAVAKAEGVMQVPLDICIHAGMVARSSLKDLILQEPQLYEMEDELLALLLMSERRQGKDSFWYPYIRSLPTRYDTPLYWGDDELKHLQGTNVLLLSRMMSSRMEQDWSSIHMVLVEKYPDVLGGLTKEDYVWALSTVWSRAIGIEDEPTGEGQDGAAEKRYMRCLAPVLDMCNHSPQAASSLDELLSLDHASRVLSLRAHASLPKNAQCHMLYGPYSNSKLLFSYGFTIHDNPYLGVDYWVKVPPTARDAEWKTNLLHSHPLTSNQTYDFAGTLRPGWISPALLATVRIIQLEADEYPLADKVVAGEAAGPRNEKATLTTLSNCIKSRLATYTTSMEEDLGSLDKLERLLEDLATQQKKAATGSDGKEGNGAMVDRLTALMDTTRRRVHALRVCLDDKVVFVQAATHVQERLRKVEEEGVQGP